jgi:hypothetical protein
MNYLSWAPNYSYGQMGGTYRSTPSIVLALDPIIFIPASSNTEPTSIGNLHLIPTSGGLHYSWNYSVEDKMNCSPLH